MNLIQAIGRADGVLLADDDRVYIQEPGDDLPPQSSIQNAVTALEEVMLLNGPDRFILETSPKKHPKSKNRRLLRSHQRPVYTLLKPKDIRRQMGLPEPGQERGSPRPHERRAHVRTYRSDRYKNVQGKSVIVPATWVGPAENVSGKKQYRVLLDR